jgi:(1->4)-alpha-D-glucan 1-alpha-D-glucosylmutase
VTIDEIIERLARDPGEPLRVPRATYRVQLGPELTFDDAAEVADYLAALGISDAYTSPFFATSGAGSHGYDVADHGRLRAELGGEDAFARFADALKRLGLGLLVDVVPNHMGIARARNAWWQDVLEHGPASPHAAAFDVDWNPVKRELADKVLLPILGDQYGAVLDAGHLQLERRGGRFVVRYYDTVLPVGPRSYARILGVRLEELNRALGAEHPAALELKSILSLFATLPVRTETDPQRLAARRRETEAAGARLDALLAESADVRDFVDANVALFNGTPGDPRSFDLLDAMLDAQVYRLAFWRVAGEEINYRRFFDINELAAIRMEVPAVFAAAHRLLFRLVRDGIVTGLRIDHPDGLYRPAEYFRRLQRGALLEVCHGLFRGAGAGEWRDQDLLARYDPLQAAGAVPAQPFYIVAEKILAPGERLPETWAVGGTTGYEFLNLLNGIFIDRANARAIDSLYARVVREHPSFAEIVYESKRLIMDSSMASELNMLAHRLNRISEKHRSSRDFTLGSLRRALREIIAAFPVYRTYLGDDEGAEAGSAGKTPSAAANARDHEYIARAVAAAKRRTPAVDPSIYDWIQDILTVRIPEWANERDRAERLDFVMRFQQITGPTTAKGYEDTALYRYNRLVSLNEVGGEPSRFGTTLAEFHAANVERARHGAHALSTTATHDTKRGEDTRVRIDVISEVPHEWRTAVLRWQRLNGRHRATVDGRPAPSPNEEYLVYQTMVGAWPVEADRLREYMLKTARESKQNTSWTNPNPRWEEALTHFVETILDEGTSADFLRDFREFHAKIVPFGILNSLAQTLIKITAPGVPDFYQGAELWDLSLVDPDNRRPVDFARRRQMLETLTTEIEATTDLRAVARRLMKDPADGCVKLFVIRQALAVRRRHAELFARGDYRPLEVQGSRAEHICAFARTGPGGPTLTVVPRLLAARGVIDPVGTEYWEDATLVLPAEVHVPLRNALTTARVEPEGAGDERRLLVGTVLADFPVALLEAA